jgi:hypothetical protein
MDTFLGAGGGAIIGDAIFPGLGTVGGLLLGGYGGRKYAEKKDRRIRAERSSMDLRRDVDDRELRDSFRPGDYRKALREDGGGQRRSRSHVEEYRHKDY